MNLSQLRAPKGATKNIKRRGRGRSSGHGKTSCRGHKGARSRSGTTTHMAFEGGQMPLIRRIPKRGFRHTDRTYFQVVNLAKFSAFEKNTVVDAKELEKKGMIKESGLPVKILGTGEVDRPLTVKANAFSGSAKKKIEKAGGKTEIVPVTR